MSKPISCRIFLRNELFLLGTLFLCKSDSIKGIEKFKEQCITDCIMCTKLTLYFLDKISVALWSATEYCYRVKGNKSLLRKADFKLYRGNDASRDFDNDVRADSVFY